jgi:hypothetical protein
MGLPTIVNTGEGGLTAAGTNLAMTLPGGGLSTDEYIVIIAKGSVACTINALTGWTELFDENVANGLAIIRYTGAGVPANPTFVQSASSRSVWGIYIIRGADKAIPPDVAVAPATGTSTTPNPPSRAVTGGPKDVLAISCFAAAGELADDDSLVTTFSGTLGLIEKTGGIGGNNLGGILGASAEQVSATSAVDPPSYIQNASRAWRAQTIIVHGQGAQTLFGAVAMPITFGKDVAGTKKTFAQVAFPITFGKAVAGDIKPAKATTVGRISLASGFSPVTRADHAIKVLARVTGGTGTIRAALYEGATNRSGDLESTALTGSLVEYTLPIPEANADDIIDYSDLEIRFWGYSAAGDAATFEIDKLWLEIPVQGAQTLFGAVSMPLTFGKAVAGTKKTFSQVALPLTFGKEVSGRRIAFGQTAFPIVFGKEVVGQRKTFGQLLSPFIFGKAVAGSRTAFGQVAFPITVSIATAGIRVGNTYFGVVSLPITFGKDVSGRRTAFGQIALPLTFAKETIGRRTTFGQVSLPIIFTKEALGQRSVFGQLSMQTLFDANTSGRRKTFSQIALPLVFSKSVAGTKKTFGQVAFPIEFEAFVDGFGYVGPKTLYGEVSFDMTFLKDTVAIRKTFGQVTAPFILGSATQGRRTTFGAAQLPMDLLFDVESGRLGVFGEVSLPIIFDVDSAGIVRPVGVVLNLAEMIYLGEEPVIAVYTQNQQIWP